MLELVHAVVRGHRLALLDESRARVLDAVEVRPAHLPGVEQFDRGPLILPCRGVAVEALRHDVGVAPQAQRGGQRHIVPAPAGGVAVDGEGHGIGTLVLQDLVVQRMPGVELARERHVPVAIGPATLALHGNVGHRFRWRAQDAPGQGVAVLPPGGGIKRHRLAVAQKVGTLL
ncbi:hypothetical protein FQZ97_996810 [compost metagenome]